MKNNFWIALAFVLLSANILFLTFFILKDKRHPHPPHAGPHHEREMTSLISERLHFDATQQKALEALSGNRSDRKQIRDSLDVLKLSLFTQGASGKIGMHERDSLLVVIGNLHCRLDLLTLRYFDQIKNICRNDAQKQDFDAFIEELVTKTLRRGPPPPPPPPISPED